MALESNLSCDHKSGEKSVNGDRIWPTTVLSDDQKSAVTLCTLLHVPQEGA